jgi:hypothetical protein
MSKSVIILGTGLTLSKFKQEDHIGSEIWAVGSSYSMFKDFDFVTKYFCLHRGEEIGFDGEIVNQENYPLQEIIKKYNSSFFTNSISYMIALALYENASSIKVYGVDLDCEEEYAFERPSVAYWIGFARGISVEVEVASNMDKPLFLYAFEDSNHLTTKLVDRMEMSYKMAQKCRENNEIEKAHQYLGQYSDCKHWIAELGQNALLKT